MAAGEAAVYLACSRQNVQYHLRQGNLVALPRARGEPIRLLADSVQALANKRGRRRRGSLGAVRPADFTGAIREIATLSASVDRLEARLRAVQTQLDRLTKAENARTTALAALMAVNDELTAANEASTRAVTAMTQAQQESAESAAALLRAHRLRVEALLQGALPATPPI